MEAPSEYFFNFLGLAPESTASGDCSGHFEVAGYPTMYSSYRIMGPVRPENYFPFFEKGHWFIENF